MIWKPAEARPIAPTDLILASQPVPETYSYAVQSSGLAAAILGTVRYVSIVEYYCNPAWSHSAG